MRVFVADAVDVEVAEAVGVHDAAAAGNPPHGHRRTQSGIQAVVASEAAHVLVPPSIMALLG